MTSRELVAALVLALGYYTGVHVGIALTFDSSPVSTLWPPNAILLSALLLTRPSAWWLMIVAVLPAHLLAEVSLGVPWAMAIAWFASNATEALLGAALITRFGGGRPRFDRVRDFSVFLIAAVVLSPAVSSFLDTTFVALVGWRYSGDYMDVWRVRFFSNALAALTLVPLIVTCCQAGLRSLRQTTSAEYVEMAALLAGICVTSAVIFQQSHQPEEAALVMYAPLPFLMWAAVRHGVRGVSLCVAIVAAFAITGVLENRGPFAWTTPANDALAVQVFLIITAASLQLLAASLSELRHARRVALQQEESLDLALRAAQMGTWEWEVGRDRMIVRTGRQGAAGTTRSPKSLSKQLERVHDEDRASVTHAIRDALARCGSLEIEYRYLLSNGGYHWVTTKGIVIVDAKGRPLRMIGVHIDTTQRKAQEIQSREQREQLTHLGRISLLGELSGALAHELNQPLTAILINAQAASREIENPSPDLAEIAAILSDIVTEDKRAGEVIKRLRALFLRGEVQMQQVDANECVAEVLTLEHSDLIRRGVTTDVRLAANLPPLVADRVQFQQVLLNLIVNACDAMANNEPGDRRLRIVSATNAAGGVDIEIRDSGHGVHDADIIFEPFFSTKDQGIGLGLSICRTIVAAHEGFLWASNNSSRGTTFHLSMPPLSRESSAVKEAKSRA